MADIKMKLITPSVPNFIFIAGPAGKRQDGWKESPKIALGDLNDGQLQDIAEEWLQALFDRANEQRKNKD